MRRRVAVERGDFKLRTHTQVPRNIPWYSILDRLRYFEGGVRRVRRGVSLRKVVKKAQPGDLLLFRGRGLFADIQEWFTGSIWTHAAIVYLTPEGILSYAEASPHISERSLVAPGTAYAVVPLGAGIDDYLQKSGLEVGFRRLVVESDVSTRDQINASIHEVVTAGVARGDDFELSAAKFTGAAYPTLSLLTSAVEKLCRLPVRFADRLAPLANKMRGLHDYLRNSGERTVYCTCFVMRCYERAGIVAPCSAKKFHGDHRAVIPADLGDAGESVFHDAKSPHAVKWTPSDRSVGLEWTEYVR